VADQGGPPTLSIVIPAHNEERVIRRCLDAVLEGIDPARIEVIVACNGCTDATPSLAAAASPAVQVVETAVASKAAALNLGDAAATAFPRVFLDADIEIHGPDLLAMATVLEEHGGPLAVAPEMRVDLSGCSWAVRAFYRVWTALPYASGDSVGSGVYALSEAGRARFDRFPAIIADDHFVNGLFPGPNERRRVRGTFFTMRPPRRVGDLVRVQRRRRAGILEYERAYGKHSRPGTRTGLAELARHPTWWPSLVVYGVITVAGLVEGIWKVRFGDLKAWERDDTARHAPNVR
jgi:glycosyltransferase involved in cell wall biosynthesis